MIDVLVAGSTGMLGNSLVPYLRESSYNVIGLGKSKQSDFNIDLTDSETASILLDTLKPKVIINLVALTNVDLCESEPQRAYALNVKVVENLSSWILTADTECHLIQISSDHVYDGLGPHLEHSLSILNQYAMSKLAGELAARLVPSTILRTNFFGQSKCVTRTSLSDWIFSSLRQSTPISVFSDVFFSPLSIPTLCSYIEKCIAKRPIGIFNLGSRNGMSKADFAFSFAMALGMSPVNFSRIQLSSIKNPVVRRPMDMRMNVEKFQVTMGVSLPTLNQEINLIVKEYLSV